MVDTQFKRLTQFQINAAACIWFSYSADRVHDHAPSELVLTELTTTMALKMILEADTKIK